MNRNILEKASKEELIDLILGLQRQDIERVRQIDLLRAKLEAAEDCIDFEMRTEYEDRVEKLTS